MSTVTAPRTTTNPSNPVPGHGHALRGDPTINRGPAAELRILVAYGTRPEAVKMAPLIQALAADPRFRTTVVVTGQHREMLDQVNRVFDIHPDIDLDIHSPGQTLTDITSRSLHGIEQIIARHAPDAVAVQGDTTTTLAVALAAFYHKVPVVHLEAGLRTNDRGAPYPEEVNRRLTTQLASVHLAPTEQSRRNLLRENVSPASVVVTGNTVIDALHWTVRSHQPYGQQELERLLAADRPMLLVTTHRRESWGEPMRAVARAIRRLAARFDNHLVVFPMHHNPVVRDAVVPILAGTANVHLAEPLPYGEFCRLMNRASAILTDSGGIQEEGPSIGKPVLVLRDTTERPEAVTAGTVSLVGTDEEAIVTAVTRLLTESDVYARMANAVNPYGDGAAAARSVAAIAHYLGHGSRPGEFDGGPIAGEPIELTRPVATPGSSRRSSGRSRGTTGEPCATSPK